MRGFCATAFVMSSGVASAPNSANVGGAHFVWVQFTHELAPVSVKIIEDPAPTPCVAMIQV